MDSLSPSLLPITVYLIVPKGMPKAILKACKIKSNFFPYLTVPSMLRC